MTGCKDITQEPLAGGMDLLSKSGALIPGDFRLVLNHSGDKPTDYCRLAGWKRYGWDQECVNNLDLHDQMIDGSGFYTLPYDYTTPATSRLIGQVFSNWNGTMGYGTLIDVVEKIPERTDEYCAPTVYYLGNQCRETPTLIASVTSDERKRRLVVATKSRIYANDDKAGNWTILADGLGGVAGSADCDCSPKRMIQAQLGNTVLFTNGIDPVMGWEIGEAAGGCYYWTADFIAELQGIGMAHAEVLAVWDGFVFVANVLDSGTLRPNRWYWSDYNDPYSWIPAADSLAGFHDFGLGEKVLFAAPLGGRFLFYTDKAIYEVTKSNNVDLVFNVTEIYRGTNVPRFRHAIVSTGTAHIYLGEDDIWVINDYDRSPNRIQWIRNAGAAIYKGISTEYLTDLPAGILNAYPPINKAACEMAAGWWNEIDQSVWFSWPTGSNDCPNLTLILWPETRKSSLLDHGITGATTHRPDTSPSLRDFLSDYGLCDPDTLRGSKEGDPCPIEFVPGDFTGLFNATEDLSLGVQPGSFFAQLCGLSINDLCRACDTGSRWLFLSASDKAIKEFTPETYSREMLTAVADATFPDVGAGTYEQVGYPSLIQSDAINFRTPTEKLIQAVTPKLIAEDQTTPGLLYCAVGTASMPGCLNWETADPVSLECLDQGDEGSRSTLPPRFAFYSKGIHVAWRLWTTGVGNAFCMNGVTFKANGASKCW